MVIVGNATDIARVARSLADKQMTAATANKLKGLKSTTPGFIIKIMPMNPMRTASQRLRPTVSRRKIAAPAVTASGVPCNIAEADDNGVSTIALTKNSAPNKSPRVLIITCLSSRSLLMIGCLATIAAVTKKTEPSIPKIIII